MKKFRFAFFLIALGTATLAAPACSQKSGCPAQESLAPKTDRKGNIKKKKRGNTSELFPKNMRKKMR